MKNTYQIIILSTLIALVSACSTTDSHRSTGDVVDDSSISTRLKTALLADKSTDGLDIEIEINQGNVQLNGFADSVEEKRRAEEIARGISGVTSVSNNLEVSEGTRSAGRYIDDKLLVAKINTALAKSDDVSALDIEVEVNSGVVILGGFVDSNDQRRAAEAATRGVDGIKKVNNNIEVR